MYCYTYTSNLSTSWSIRNFIRNTHLWGSFPLRCFQRLSFPYLATQLCLWQDNWNTSGTSTPVLSY
ncbi:hypothetical protein B5M19_02175 [Mesomycoplasma hyopneumoniae]|nr:hypothetical protein B5M19_02175 [Mesomycoplasma hyopneumoniae]